MKTEKKQGALYLVSTPIGNMGDITLRALEVLAQASLIAAEDTRKTRKILSAHDIHTPMVSFFEHNEIRRTDEILARLSQGRDVALVTNAGTPTVSDPGYPLVREAAESGHAVIPVPGACAPVAALAASGLPTDRFAFEGFLPRKGAARAQRLRELAGYKGTVILFEAPNRLAKTLEDLLSALGNAPCVVAREMTKLHEEFIRGDITDVLDHVRHNTPKGESTIVLDVRSAQATDPESRPEEIEGACRELIASGRLKGGAVAARIARRFGIGREQAYRVYLKVREESRQNERDQGTD